MRTWVYVDGFNAVVIGVANPFRKRASRELTAHANFTKTVRKSLLASSQFPVQLSDANGTFSKPASW